LIKTELDNFFGVLAQRDEWTIVGHAIPDGDCIGAVTAMGLVLKSMGKKVSILVEDGLPARYEFLPGSLMVGSLAELPRIFDARIYLDCADLERIGERTLNILPEASITVNIDHHISNTRFGHINLVDEKASSTCEVIYCLLKQLNLPITKDMATSLYCGVVMDTGSFQYASTSPSTHRMAAEFLELGIDLNHIGTNLYESKTRQEIMVIKMALSSLDTSPDGRLAWMELGYQELLEISAENLHFEGVINLARSIKDVEVAMLFRETEPGSVKVGFRSKGAVDVNRIARNWGGGGHIRAAGASLSGDLPTVKELVISKVKEELA